MNHDKLESILKYYIFLCYPLRVKDFEVLMLKNHKVEKYMSIISYKESIVVYTYLKIK